MESKVASKIFHVKFQAPQHSYFLQSQHRSYVFTGCKLWPKYTFLFLMLLMDAKV